jgi:hypothetical protein
MDSWRETEIGSYSWCTFSLHSSWKAKRFVPPRTASRTVNPVRCGEGRTRTELENSAREIVVGVRVNGKSWRAEDTETNVTGPMFNGRKVILDVAGVHLLYK